MYRKDYIFINNCIQDGRCALIFNFSAPLEWVERKATEESALHLARIFDKAECLYQAESDTFIYASEVLGECKRVDPSVSFPELPVLCYLQKGSQYTPAQTVIAQHVPDYDFGSTDKSSFPDHVPVVQSVTMSLKLYAGRKRIPEVYEKRMKVTMKHSYRILHEQEIVLMGFQRKIKSVGSRDLFKLIRF